MDVFEFDHFRPYLKLVLSQMPKGGHGQARRLAEAAGISAAFLSQILADRRLLTPEQASLMAEFIGLNEVQTEYFLTLVELDRAGNPSLRSILQKRQKRLKETGRVIAKRFRHVTEVSEKHQPIYYSDWSYIAIQQLSAIPGFHKEFSIAKKLDLPLKKVRDVIQFLLAAGLCVHEGERLGIGPARIHLAPDSPWIKQHHQNWRFKALENYDRQDSHDRLHYSAPMTLSKTDCEKVRKILLEVIASVARVVDPSPSEELTCLNIDWFRITR